MPGMEVKWMSDRILPARELGEEACMNVSSYSESGRRPATEPELCGDTRRRTATDRGVKVEGLCKKIK